MQKIIKYGLHVCFMIFVLCLFTGCGKKTFSMESAADATVEITIEATTEVDIEVATEADIKATVEDSTESIGEVVTEASDGVETYPVYVCGAVLNPGVYYLCQGDIKDVAIRAAGGFAEDAEENYVNLAEEISYGEQIYVPTKTELADAVQQSSYSPWLVGSTNQISSDGQVDNPSSDGRVNLNTATKAELMTLPGIGENKANAIIQYRETQGYFQTESDVMKVEGIKDGVYDKIKDFIVVD